MRTCLLLVCAFALAGCAQTPDSPEAPRDGLDGRVVSVDGERVTISLGANDGLRVGDELHVSHGDQYVGMIRVNHVEKNRAVGVTTEVRGSGYPLGKNDRVYRSAPIKGPGPPEALVTGVDGERVTISMGANGALRLDGALDVTRGTQYVCMIRVRDVEENQTVCVTTNTRGPGFPPQLNDGVSIWREGRAKYASPFSDNRRLPEALVLSVNGSWVTVSMGSRDGVQMGEVLHVTRGKNYVGIIRVDHVEKERATGLTTEVRGPGFPPQLNDRVYAR